MMISAQPDGDSWKVLVMQPPIETDVDHRRDARSVPADEQTLQKCRIAR